MALTCACRRGGPPARETPVVLICVDTLRADHLPAYGYRGVATPALDALARDSILFENAYSHVPLTLASHATIFTGLLPPQTGIRDNYGFTLPPGLETIASLLKASGRATGGAVSAFVLTRKTGIDRGFDFYDDAIEQADPPERPGNITEQSLEKWLEGVRSGPFFAFLHLFEPHAPYEPPEPYRSRYALAYDGEIARADEIVGTFLARLKSWGLYDRSLIVFLSDHGEGLRDHGEQEHGIFLYREAIHVPLLVKLPTGRRAGEKVSAPVSLTDIFPTIAREVGRTPPVGLQGRNLLNSQELAAPRRIYGETFYPRLRLGWSDLASLIDDRNHYIEAPRAELYDILADPSEKRDLSASLPPAFRSLRLELSQMTRPFRMPAEGDTEHAKKLAALGYLTATSADARAATLPDPKDRIALLDGRPDFQKFLARKDDAAVIAASREFVRKVPAALDVWRMLADSLERQGKREEAIRALKEGLAATSATTVPELRAPALERLTYLLVRAGRGKEALEVGDASFTDPEALTAFGIAQAEAGQLAPAIAVFRKALERDPEYALAHLNLGTALARSGDVRGALEHLEHAVKSDPAIASAWNALGSARARQGDEAGALECWKRAVDLDPTQYDALYNIAIVEGRRGNVEAARKSLQRFVATAPPALFAKDLAEARRLLSSLGRS